MRAHKAGWVALVLAVAVSTVALRSRRVPSMPGRIAPLPNLGQAKLEALDPDARRKGVSLVRQLTDSTFGTPASPRPGKAVQLDDAHLIRGRDVFLRRCAVCHGENGDGTGRLSNSTDPPARNFLRSGRVKFKSTHEFVYFPCLNDLVRVAAAGMEDACEPIVPHDAEECDCVARYVAVLLLRSRLEELLSCRFADDGGLSQSAIKACREEVIGSWEEAQSPNAIFAVPATPSLTPLEHSGGKVLFASHCSQCHGTDGPGGGETMNNPSNRLDTWGWRAKATNLVDGAFRGGDDPADLYRRISEGISGTAMPGFGRALSNRDIWILVHWTRQQHNKRKSG